MTLCRTARRSIIKEDYSHGLYMVDRFNKNSKINLVWHLLVTELTGCRALVCVTYWLLRY